MSTTDQRPSPAPTAEPAPPTKPKIDLSLTQVLGGALAAMTAAFLGSRLSLAGTVAGAAVASIVAAVAGNVYTASLRTTREKVQTVFRGRVVDSGLPVTIESTEDTPTRPEAQTATARTSAPTPRPRRQWPSILLGAVAAFALAAAVLTGLEVASGHSLSGHSGTTVTQVAKHAAGAGPTTTPPRATTTSPRPSPSPSVTDSPQPSASPSTEPSATPSGSPSATEPTPSATPSGAPSSTPAPSATTTPGAGDQAGAAEQGTVGSNAG